MNQQQEFQLRKEAANRGYNPQQINQFVDFAKQKEKAPVPAPVEQPKGEGFLKKLVKGAVNPFIRLGATADSLGTSKILGGKGADLSTKRVPVLGAVEPIRNAKDAASVGGELVLEAVGGEVASRLVKPLIKGAVGAVRAGKQAFKQAPKVIEEGIESAASTLDEGTKSVLNPLRRIPKEKLPEAAERINPDTLFKRAESVKQKTDRYFKVAQKAAKNPAADTPLDVAGKEAERALNTIQDKLSKWGEVKKATLDEVGNKTITGLKQARQQFREAVSKELGIDVSDQGVKNAFGRISKVAPEDQGLIKEVDDLLGQLKGRDTLQKVDDLVDQIQDRLYKRKSPTAVQVNSKVERVLKQAIGKLNNNLKLRAGSTYSKANLKYSQLIDNFEKLNKALGLDASKGGSLMKRVFSPQDGGTKKLFREIKKITGIDLVEEANLAKLAMESVGDSRAMSLLESLELLRPQGALGTVEKGVKFLLKKAQDPIKETNRIIEQSKQVYPR